MANVGGPRQQSRQVLAGVVRSIILYGSTVWLDAFKRPSYTRAINATYRLCALRVCSAFRTVSGDAASVIAGLCPLDLVAQELHETRKVNRDQPGTVHSAGKAAAKECSEAQWQIRWDRATKGRWTYRLIPKIGTWLSRQHGTVDYYLTQVISGHGCFKAYLYRVGHAQNPYCEQCGPSVIEDAEHAFFKCPRFNSIRSALNTKRGSCITPENMVGIMLTSEEAWNDVCHFSAEVIKALRRNLN